MSRLLPQHTMPPLMRWITIAIARRAAGGTRRLLASTAATARQPLALAYDLETTGLVDAQIIQFAAVALPKSSSDEASSSSSFSPSSSEFEGLCMPTIEIDPRATKVHGFTREILAKRGAVPFASLFASLEHWVQAQVMDDAQPVVWTAHNGHRFDHPIFRREVERALGSGGGGVWPASWHWEDTLPLARRVLPRGSRSTDHKLSTLFELCAGERLVDAHDALGDARAVARIWPWLATNGTGDVEMFRAHLEAATRPSRGELSTKRAKRRVFGDGSSSSTRRSAASATPVCTRDPVTVIPGIAARSAAQLKQVGITDVSELLVVWEAQGRSKILMREWLPRSMHKIVAAKLAVWLAEHAAAVVAEEEA